MTDTIAMLHELPRPSLVALLASARVAASPYADTLTLRQVAIDLHELGTLDATQIATEWESLS